MWAATNALNGSLQVGLRDFSFPNHILELPLSALYNIAHGAGLSIIIPAWMRWYRDYNKPQFKRFAKVFFKTDSIETAIVGLESWFSSIGAPVRLREIDIFEDSFDKLGELANQLAKLRGGLDKLYTVEACKEIYNLAK
jgi:hypothetical protein